MSSRFASSTTMSSSTAAPARLASRNVAPRAAASPIKSRSTFGCSASCALPAPSPMDATVISGCGPNLDARRGHNRRARRRHQLALNSVRIRRRASQQLRRRRGRHRQIAVLRFHSSAAHIQRRAKKLLDAELVESRRRAHDIHDRVHRAHLVEMHFFNRRTVDERFGFAQPLKNARRAFGNRMRQSALAQSTEECRKATDARCGSDVSTFTCVA